MKCSGSGSDSVVICTSAVRVGYTMRNILCKYQAFLIAHAQLMLVVVAGLGVQLLQFPECQARSHKSWAEHELSLALF